MSLRGQSTPIPNYTGAPGPIVIPTTTVVYSRSFKIYYGQTFGAQYKAANGSGTANMKIQLEQSNTLLADSEEGASNANWVIGSGVADIETNLADTLTHIKSFVPAPTNYARFKITGLGSNPADASLNIQVFQQEVVV